LFHFREELSSLDDVESLKKKVACQGIFLVATFSQLAKFFLKLAKKIVFFFGFLVTKFQNFEKNFFQNCWISLLGFKNM
jgi:hypothetical protein